MNITASSIAWLDARYRPPALPPGLPRDDLRVHTHAPPAPGTGARRRSMGTVTGESPDDSGPGGASRRDVHPPMPRDKRGWQVAPAPDGRGMPERTPSGPPPHRRIGFWWFVLALIAINWLSVSVLHARGPAARDGGLQPLLPGTGARPGRSARSPPRATRSRARSRASCATRRATPRATQTTLFATEVPTFWNGSQLSALLQEKGVADQRQVDQHEPVAARRAAARLRAHPADRGPVRAVRAPRRQGRRRHGRARQLRPLAGAPRGPRDDPRDLRRRRRDRRGEGGADGDRRLPASARALRAPGRAHAARRSALGCAGHGQDAARPRRRGRGARGVLLDLRLGVHRGDRRRRRLARAGPVRQGQGGGARDHLHRRARRDRTLPPGLGVGDGLQRRARADARPDPHRDRRLRVLRGGRRARCDQPARRARPRAAARRVASTAASPCRRPTARGAWRS